MIYILLNFLLIAAATLAGLAIGIVWLRASRMLLPGWQTLALAALAEFWLAAILAGALILAPPEAGAWTMALGSAFVIWVGFVLPVIWVTFTVYRLERGSALSASAHWLAVMLTQAAVMQGWGLTAPGT
ncbi:hypothetical protein [Erythrobacter sp. JK5]|uniref:hypothetical protein n=1 Tax=Erythrobacter sp. JK5 TaxID=2829500 RepID=UPI001BA8D8DD|nr:hypothetical protein [Erythrobacter sp. JK5]QUL36519.1 hypothetical protein KDC96_08665 [Erythrobacter sp. JK5]